jgi:hypothetical protein
MAITPRDRLELLEASDRERRSLQRDLDLLAYTALDYAGGQPQELKAVERRKLAQKARVVWMRDPLAGASIDLMNDFTFGRGLGSRRRRTRPCRRFWTRRGTIPTTRRSSPRSGPGALGTDLSLTANVFLKVFDDGDDGKVKLGLLKNDLVEDVVRDPEVPQRILWFVARPTSRSGTTRRASPYTTANPHVPNTDGKKVYYPHWRNVDADGRGGRERASGRSRTCRPATRSATARSSTSRSTARRTWPRAPDDGSAAALVQRLQPLHGCAGGHHGGERRLRDEAQGQGHAGAASEDGDAGALAGGASWAARAIPMRLAGGPARRAFWSRTRRSRTRTSTSTRTRRQAAQDAQMLRANVSAGTRFPQSYYGDASNSTLATATSLELPVLKAVESRQEKFEAACGSSRSRDRAGGGHGQSRLELTPEEIEALKTPSTEEGRLAAPIGTTQAMLGLGRREAHEDAQRMRIADGARPELRVLDAVAAEAHDERPDHGDHERRQDVRPEQHEHRAVAHPARDRARRGARARRIRAGAVDKIFPRRGYEDPAIAAAQAQPSLIVALVALAAFLLILFSGDLRSRL